MTSANAKLVMEKLHQIRCDGYTNLLDGLKTAYGYLHSNPLDQTPEQFFNRHMILLTDGMPCVNEPEYNKRLLDKNTYRQFLETEMANNDISKHTLLHVFGLCYDELQDLLLIEIAKVGHGMYGFISDPSIIVQCFINIIAVMFNMFVTGLTLKISPDKEIFVPWVLQQGSVTLFTPNVGQQIELISNSNRRMRVIMNVSNKPDQIQLAHMTLLRHAVSDIITNILNTKDWKTGISLALATIREYKNKDLNDMFEKWRVVLEKDVDLYSRILPEVMSKCGTYIGMSLATALLGDYITNPYEKEYKHRSGQRFTYWIESIEEVAKNIKLPNPTFQPYLGDGGSIAQPPSYNYNNNYNDNSYSRFTSSYADDHDDGCIDGNCEVEMANGEKKLVKDIKIGDRVKTDGYSGVGVVRCLFLEPNNIFIELPNGLRLTRMHPVWYNDWILPINHPEGKLIELASPIDMYCFLLEENEQDQSWSMFINGHWVVHFAHKSDHKTLVHPFYGTDSVRRTAERIDQNRTGLIKVTNAVRDANNVVCEYEGVSL
jgi:hypothetical protein